MTVYSDFLLELHDLLKKYQGELYYTNEDDGIHVSCFGYDIFTGVLHADNLGGLREAIRAHGGSFLNKEKEKEADKIMKQNGYK